LAARTEPDSAEEEEAALENPDESA
jgi:hypothetical protein